MQPHEDWPSKTKRLIFNIFLIILLLIAVAKVIREELKGLPWPGGFQIIFAMQQMEGVQVPVASVLLGQMHQPVNFGV